MWPSVSFIVPLYNQLAHTQAMLASLLHTVPLGLEHEILLIDDASSDGTPDWLATLGGGRVKTFRNDVNRGYAASNNIAIRQAKGDVVALLNNDLLLEDGWLPPMLEVLAQDFLRVGVVGNLQRRVQGGALDHAGFSLNSFGQLCHIQDMPEPERLWSKALAVTGACMLLRRAEYWACGGFDENFQNGGEDVDLCFKLKAHRGLDAYVANGSCVGHHVSLSRGSAPSLTNERNSRYLYWKWRKRLKSELSINWFRYLVGGGEPPCPPQQWVEQELLATPSLASLRIAEAILCQQEDRWNELLGPANF